jgi:hypothetical protein
MIKWRGNVAKYSTKRTYALKSYADYKTQILENQLSGLLLKIEGNEVWVKLIGNFNAYNVRHLRHGHRTGVR